MSYYQDGGTIIHLPASTHSVYSHAQPTPRMNYGTSSSSSGYHGTTTTTTTTTGGATSIDSGNLSLESQTALLEAGQLLLLSSNNNTSNINITSNNNAGGGGGGISNTTTTNNNNRRNKPDIGMVASLLSFLVWLRLLQTMFYQSALGNLEGWFLKEFLSILLVWIPSLMLTCFYFRSDDYQRRFRL